MRLLILIVSIAAIGLAAALAALGPGVRLGFWDYSTALGWMRNILALPLLIAAGLSALALLLALWKARGLAPLALIAFIAAVAAGYAPLKMKAMVEANPLIHDITTDFEHPPAIVAGAGADRKNPPDYLADETVPRTDPPQTLAEAQMAAFPDIQPLIVSGKLEDAVKAARAAVAGMGMETLAEGPVSDESGSGWRIEAVSTSFWYGFKDDFIVRLSPGLDGGVRIDVRSKSRVGLSDLGANATRVRAFLARMKSAA
ncbi:MAG: DUF1499 domain-containing protein [Pseudomonadota bacterium]|nr:DUF1499 domain-containing protein [Pseudomonadota bacterium]